MTVLERKVQLVRAILDDTDEDRVEEMARLYRRLSARKKEETPSFMCSLEELKASLPEIEKEFADGKFIWHEDIKRK